MLTVQTLAACVLAAATGCAVAQTVKVQQCGRVTNYKNNKFKFFNFFKAIKGTWWMPWL